MTALVKYNNDIKTGSLRSTCSTLLQFLEKTVDLLRIPNLG
jgi:hypothetical protein